MKKELPAQPSLEQLRKQAKDLLKTLPLKNPGTLARIRESLPELQGKSDGQILAAGLRLHDAQSVIAREYGFDSWPKLKEEVEKRAAARLQPLIDQFRNLVRRGAADELRDLLRENPSLKAKLDAPLFAFGSPAIRIAADQKNRGLVEVLLAAGADINKRSEWAPGSFGVLDNADEEFGRYLLEKGATLDVHSAAGLGREEELRRMLDQDPALVNQRGGDGGTPMHFAKNLAVAGLLLERGADIAMRDLDHGSTAAMWQVQNREVLYRLIGAGSPIDIFMACVHGDIDLAKRALAEDPECLSSVIGTGKFTQHTGGNIYNWKISFGGRPIAVAAFHRHHELVEFLSAQAEPKDVFINACSEADAAGARAVLEEHPGILSTLNEQDLRALADAVWFGRKESVKVFVECGFPLTGRGQDNGTLLHLAAWSGQPDMVRELIRLGADLEDRGDIHGSTPLGWACHGALNCGTPNRDHLGAVKALLEAGARPDALANKYGEILLDWATPEIAEEIKRHGRRPA